MYCTHLASVTIPINVTNHGWRAFSDCSSLGTVMQTNGFGFRTSGATNATVEVEASTTLACPLVTRQHPYARGGVVRFP